VCITGLCHRGLASPAGLCYHLSAWPRACHSGQQLLKRPVGWPAWKWQV